MGCEKLDIRECFTFIGSPLQRRSDVAYTPTTTTDVAITNFTLIISTIIHNIIKSISDIRECRLYTYDQLPSLAFPLTTTYAYDTLVRYTYFSNNKLVSSISLSVSSLPSVESVNAYELHSNLITSVENKHNSTTIGKYDYSNDALGRGTAMEKTGTAFSANDTINYAYNPRSEVTSATSANDATYDYTFAFDTIGNRTSSSTASTTSTYSTNNLNQYTNITNPNQAPTYDDDGNMTQCSSGFQPESWSFTYNAENRVIVAESAATKLEFTYDYMGRRVEKKVYSGSTSNWSLVTDNRYVYDNYKQIEELDALNSNAIAKKRVWSNGKIIADIHGTNTYYALGDANKNITEYVDGSGTVQAHYEYSPFGKITASNGAMTDDFDYRFSSEVFDGETGLVYYNHRYYSPELGRWLSRDPIQEEGGFNLYGMVGNSAVNKWDRFGLTATDPAFCKNYEKQLDQKIKEFKKSYNRREIWTTGWRDIANEIQHFYPLSFTEWGEYSMDYIRESLGDSIASAGVILPNPLENILGGQIMMYLDPLKDALDEYSQINAFPNDECKAAYQELAGKKGITEKAISLSNWWDTWDSEIASDCPCLYGRRYSDIQEWKDWWNDHADAMKKELKKAAEKVKRKCSNQ